VGHRTGPHAVRALGLLSGIVSKSFIFHPVAVVTVPPELWRHIQVCRFLFWSMSVHAKTRQQTEVQSDLLSGSDVQNRSVHV